MKALASHEPVIAALPDTAAARVLVADDDESMRRLVSRALRRHGFEVIEASDGVAAVEAASIATPQVAVVDLQMPRMGGFEVVRALKARHRAELPVLVLSGLDDPDDRVRAFEAGADDFVPKPVYMPELLKRVDAFERTRRAYLELQRANERADRLRLFGAEAAALLAHDLNNGLSIANANLLYLSGELLLEGEPAEALAATVRALRRMSKLVSNFVDISRLEDAAIEPERVTVEVAELLTSSALIHDPRREPGDRPIAVDCAAGLTAEIDPVLVERVIHNLLNNATRYVDRGGLIALIAHRWEDPFGAQWLHIGVGNTGQPVPADLKLTLFDKYRTGRDGKAQRGMGLYFCRLACEAHGGAIVLRSHERFATYFAVELPA